VPTMIRWPGTIQPGTIYNDMVAHYDLITTFAAADGEPDVVAKARTGYAAGNKTYKVHLDGFNLIPFFRGEVQESPRKEFLYWNDDGELAAIRHNEWKVVFKEQNHTGWDIWEKEFENLRVPKLFNLRARSLRARRHVVHLRKMEV
jgi:arylsulfatase